MMNIKDVLLQWFISFFISLLVDKSASGRVIKNENMSNKELAEELHKPINRKFRKRKVYSSVKDNIWGTGLADMQLISTFNKGIPFCYVLLIFLINTHKVFL